MRLPKWLTGTVVHGKPTVIKLAVRKGWKCIGDGLDNSEVHVYPLDDSRDHDFEVGDGDSCACQPRAELQQRDEGGDAWIYIHNSFDGREATE